MDRQQDQLSLHLRVRPAVTPRLATTLDFSEFPPTIAWDFHLSQLPAAGIRSVDVPILPGGAHRFDCGDPLLPCSGAVSPESTVVNVLTCEFAILSES